MRKRDKNFTLLVKKIFISDLQANTKTPRKKYDKKGLANAKAHHIF